MNMNDDDEYLGFCTKRYFPPEKRAGQFKMMLSEVESCHRSNDVAFCL